MATPSRHSTRDIHATQRKTRATPGKIPIPKGRWAPIVIDPDNPQTGGIFAVFHQLGQAAGLMTIYALSQTAGNYKAGHPDDWEIPESDFMAVCNTYCADTVRKAKRALEAHSIFPQNEGTGKRRRFGVNLEAIDALAAEGPPPARKAPKCKPRTEPDLEVVMVRVPGSLGELPINDACSSAGGEGAKCACPLHTISATRFVEAEGVNDTLPRTQSGLDSSPPPKTEPPPAADPGPSGSVSADDLRVALAPLCQEVFNAVAATGPLWVMSASILAGVDDIPAMRDKIEACRGKRKKEIGLLVSFAREIAAERALNIQVPEPEPEGPLSPFERAERERGRRGKKH